MTKDIFTFSSTLIERVQKEITAAPVDHVPQQIASQAVQVIKQAIAELKNFCKTYRFSNKGEEIRFFKEVKPVLVSQYLYQRGRWKALLADAYSDTAKRIKYYTDALTQLRNFAQRNDAFYHYCLSGASYNDNHYFTRQPHAIKDINQDDHFSTSHDMKLAKVLAYEMLREYFVQNLEALQVHGVLDASPIEWTASKSAATELIYALQSVGAVNNGKTDLKSFVAHFERVFKINLGNYYRSFHEMSIRRGSRTIFLDALKERLLTKFDELNE
jgi:hypothetical protein